MFMIFAAFQQFVPNSPEPPLTASRVSDSENCWVAWPKNEREKEFSYGYIYIDSTAGWTYHLEGNFSCDKSGELLKGTDAMPEAMLKMRLENDFPVLKLSKIGLYQLQLPDAPDWIKYYQVDKDSLRSQVHWGYCYNHIGRPDKALQYLEQAYKSDETTRNLLFELGFAYNALKLFENAQKLLSAEFAKFPTDHLLARELAYTFLELGKFEKAVEIYLQGISICPIERMDSKIEMAKNLAQAYKLLGDTPNCNKWLFKVRQWASENSSFT
jgi:tetratricopeptide (TPR) repeat protein